MTGAPRKEHEDGLAYYRMALNCGHRTWFSRVASSGVDRCSLCGQNVGVFVTRIDPPANERSI